ncbi:hypothetical protein A0H81_05276 [Grifola frondosa]|uniref:Heterokaryon incompatibility domain-containing protein n=1 Tax=Grifola frondosa TaxID=5627 RepID=A0A1C7MBZ3_GRIFR|nr:hypothetical protein A0H81_05276 [Grifola frondosa]
MRLPRGDTFDLSFNVRNQICQRRSGECRPVIRAQGAMNMLDPAVLSAAVSDLSLTSFCLFPACLLPVPLFIRYTLAHPVIIHFDCLKQPTLKMRLLHVDTMEFHEFPDTRTTPPYAILSHVWRQEEVLFHHMSKRSEAQKMRGFEKIRKCCEVAAKAGYDLVWIDTCCIDKTSSSELSEAINSMFAWYRNADLCYAYLDDVSYNNGSVGLDFSRSKWFSRGWTLQELIAPKKTISRTSLMLIVTC